MEDAGAAGGGVWVGEEETSCGGGETMGRVAAGTGEWVWWVGGGEEVIIGW